MCLLLLVHPPIASPRRFISKIIFFLFHFSGLGVGVCWNFLFKCTKKLYNIKFLFFWSTILWFSVQFVKRHIIPMLRSVVEQLYVFSLLAYLPRKFTVSFFSFRWLYHIERQEDKIAHIVSCCFLESLCLCIFHVHHCFFYQRSRESSTMNNYFRLFSVFIDLIVTMVFTTSFTYEMFQSNWIVIDTIVLF